jgi:hypothetical protein
MTAKSPKQSLKRARKGSHQVALSSILPALVKAELKEPRPADTADQNDKRNYALRFSNALAQLVADAIRVRHERFLTIKPDRDGKGQESKARTHKGFKKLDVNYSTLTLGLALGVSIKTVNHKDVKRDKNKNIKDIARYDHNLSRHDTEFLAESSAYHQRQPYAVMVALFFMPADGATDGVVSKKGVVTRASSFGRAVQWFHHRANRLRPEDDPNLFERVFVGLYNRDDPDRGDVRFFDVMAAPPKNARPPDRDLLTLDQVVGEIVEAFERRNGLTFKWATGESGEDVANGDETESAEDV